MSDVTQILNDLQRGDRSAASELMPLVYAELRHLADHKMRKEAAGQTLQPTALVHEAYLRLIGDNSIEWDGRAHFFAAAAEAMRRILIENARKRKSAKHGGEVAHFEISDGDATINPDNLGPDAVLSVRIRHAGVGGHFRQRHARDGGLR